MKRLGSILGNVFLVIYLLAIHLFAGLFLYETALKKYIYVEPAQSIAVSDPTETTPQPTPAPVPSVFADASPEQTPNQPPDTGNPAAPAAESSPQIVAETADASGKIMIPVVGIKRDQITDTFNAARSSGRVHNANDIMAAGGTSVVAAVDGEIAKFFDSVRGGTTIYQYDADKRRVFYYAHLQKRADNLKEHDVVKKGTVIGFVGDTGNSGAGNYHLHFAITILDDPKNVFKGTEINPYPLLKDGIEAQ